MGKKHDEQLLFELVGAVKGFGLIGNFVNSAKYSLYKQLKDSKAYSILGIDWKTFCRENLGRDQKTVNEEIKILEEYGEPFMKAAESLRLSKRDLSALGSGLDENAKAALRNGVLTIGDTSFKIDEIEDNVDEFNQVVTELISNTEEKTKNNKALKRLSESKDKTINKLHDELDKYEGGTKVGDIDGIEKDFHDEIEKVRTSFDGYMLSVAPKRIARLAYGAKPTDRMRAEYFSLIEYMTKQVLALSDAAPTGFGTKAMCPDTGWTPGKGGVVDKDNKKV
ncbi:MAG: hypothetical protein KAR06_05645 [Deltaproteobacteria bacterium]|nr:hypothetical protein [Deltaproteobacteria bacterium]